MRIPCRFTFPCAFVRPNDLKMLPRLHVGIPGLTALASIVIAVNSAEICPISFDGRIPENATKGMFDTTQSPFNAKYVKGQSMPWATTCL